MATESVRSLQDIFWRNQEKATTLTQAVAVLADAVPALPVDGARLKVQQQKQQQCEARPGDRQTPDDRLDGRQWQTSMKEASG